MLYRATRLVLPILLGLVDSAGGTETTKPVLSLAMHYTHAHDRMLEAGYHAFRVIPPDTEAYKQHFAFRDEIPRRFPEAVECAPTGKSPCNFLFIRGEDEIVEITTTGERPDTMRVRNIRALTPHQAESLYEK